MTWPAIDHSGLSPSGRVSKRARKAWQDREAARLFPPGTFPAPTPPQPAPAERLRLNAARLRDLAGRGMSPRKFAREAARLEAEAAALEASEPRCGPCGRPAGRIPLRVVFTPGRARVVCDGCLERVQRGAEAWAFCYLPTRRPR